MKYSPHPYQNKAERFTSDNPKSALWLQPGLGKTVVALSVISKWLDEFEIHKVLIVSTIRIVSSVWPREISKWDHTRHLGFSLLHGTAKERANNSKSTAEIHGINVENIPWLVKTWWKKWPYDCVVIDESSLFKNHNTKRFFAIRKVLVDITHLLELTGTPAPAGLINLWPQLFFLDSGARLGRTISAYRNTYFIRSFNGYSWDLRDGADRQIHERVSDKVFALKAEDYLDMPDKINNWIEMDMTPVFEAQYKNFVKEFVLELAGKKITALNAAALTTKLLQVCNGAIYFDGKKYEEIHDEKLNAVEEIIEEEDGPVIIAYWYQHDLKRLESRFPQGVKLDKNPDTVDRWNAGEIDVLFIHPASGGHGLNLQAGGRTIIWFSLTWSLELYEQLIARIYRQGQERTVFVHHIVWRGSIEKQIRRALKNRLNTQNALIGAVKDMVGELGTRSSEGKWK